MHTCPECQLMHGQADVDDGAGQLAAAAPVVEAPGPNEHDVAIAEIQADAEVAQAKIYAQQGDEDLRLEVERLRGELEGMRQGAELAAEAAAEAAPPPAPVVVEAPADPVEAAPPVPAPPPAVEAPAPKEKKRSNYFGF